MAGADPNLEWLGHVQPTGLVVAPSVLARHGLVPEEQTRADSEAAAEHLSNDDAGPVLRTPWAFFEGILGWRPAQVAGAPGGPPLPDDLAAHLPEADTTLLPSWAVAEPDGGWQLLVRVEAPGAGPDARGALEGWEATPHQRLERLLRETGVPAGLLLTDRELRLVHAPRGETSGWLAFPLRALGTVGGRPMLGGLKLLLSSFRLHNDAADRRLPALLKASREAQAEVSSRLATQVLGALHELLRGLHAADRARIERLAAGSPARLYEGLLTVLLRLVFLLYAEDRALIPSRADGPARALYDEGYGARALHARLLDDAARYPDTMDERRGAWGRLLALFRLVHGGHPSGWITGRGGGLFDPAAFPFLQGQDAAGDPPAPAHVTDGCILRVLDGLLTLEGERLSYRTLDVEQIGSVYETVMGFTVTAMPGPALAVKAGKNNRTPVFVDLRALAAASGKDRAKLLRERADRGQLPKSVADALAAAADEAGVIAALRPIVDERGSPGGRAMPPGTPLLQPTGERRRTGSHYTPRSLTGPIVRHALAPAFERIGPDARPEAVLALKVCDPAMGSGAFLVEACRQLAARLVRAWARYPGTRPEIPPDEDEDLLARRLVAQRCLHGVDRNPMATDLARLSLWLATLARDHEFTFLDHALKTGDSLVGLTREQTVALGWGDGRQGSLFGSVVAERVAEALKARAEIREAPDDVARAVQEARHRSLERRLEDARRLADAVVATFFAHDRPKAREAARRELEDLGGRDADAAWARIGELAASLRQGSHPLRPFHWEIEFPEVFEGEEPGFDAIVGNPPFAGKNTLIASHRERYPDWLRTIHEGAHGNADLVAHFFRRAFVLLRRGGAFGLIATNTIRQGDTRATSLRPIREAGGTIFRAVRRLRWPGEAAVVVSVVHIRKGSHPGPVELDGRLVERITAFLFPRGGDADPVRLAANAGKGFQGSIVLGKGFTFDDTDQTGEANPLTEMQQLIDESSHNGERIFPYIGGEEVNSNPTHAHHRYVINFGTMTESEARRWPDLMSIVEAKILGKRASHSTAEWWHFERLRAELYEAVRGLPRVLVNSSKAAPQYAVAMLPSHMIYSQNLNVFALPTMACFCSLQCRVHET